MAYDREVREPYGIGHWPIVICHWRNDGCHLIRPLRTCATKIDSLTYRWVIWSWGNLTGNMTPFIGHPNIGHTGKTHIRLDRQLSPCINCSSSRSKHHETSAISSRNPGMCRSYAWPEFRPRASRTDRSVLRHLPQSKNKDSGSDARQDGSRAR